MRSILKALVVSSSMALGTLPANAAFQVIYDVLGVYDDGGATNAGLATTIFCSNVSNSAANVQVNAFSETGQLLGGKRVSVGAGDTVFFSTHQTLAFFDTATSLDTGTFSGRARIFAEVPGAIVCAADVVDASTFPPSRIVPRRMIRYPRGTSGGED
jgi:hypothetical protein